MTPLRQQMMAALELNGKSPATVEAYVREVALVAKFYRKRPDLISEEELVRYLLHRKNVNKLAPTSMRICYSGLRFFYQRVLAREWKIFALLRARRELRRPCVLSRAEVHRILKAAYPFHNQVYFTTVYSCGLRLHEALHLEIGDIDSQRGRCTSIVARAHATASCPCPCKPCSCSASTGNRIVIPACCFPPPARITSERPPPPLP